MAGVTSPIQFLSVTPDRWPDLDRLFSQSAGEDLGNPSRCWCMEWRLEQHRDWLEGAGDTNRDRMHAFIEAGNVPGILACIGGEPAGWCSISPRPSLIGLKSVGRYRNFADPSVWVVLCFYVPESRRGQGLMQMLLETAAAYAFDNGARIVVLQVDDRRAPHSTPDHRYFVRIGSTKREADGSEIAALFSRSRSASFEDMPLVDADIADLDEALVWSYARDLEGELFHQPAGFPTARVLRDLSLAVDYGMSLTPTLAGFLLFARSEAVEQIVGQNKLLLTRYSGRDASAPVVERVELRGNLTRVFERALSFIRRYVDLWDTRPARASIGNDPVPARANYPRSAVIESLTNMLAHRDYAMVEPPSRTLIFDDRIEMINPSRAEAATKKSVEYGAISRPNPRLHHIFTRAEYGLERAERGVPALRRAHFQFARREPRISLLGDEFRIELYGI